MKNVFFLILTMVTISNVAGQELKPIKLNAPDKKRGVSIMEALEKRHSVREYANKALSQQDLADLLWAANGISRPATGKRTAPSAMNMQEVAVYVCLPEGAYLYDDGTHSLQPVVKKDLRPLVAGQQKFAAEAPVCLVLVADIARFQSGDKAQNLLMGAVDAGIVSQNISLFCAGVGLESVPRASMDQVGLRKALNLKDSQHLLMNHPVGYTK